MMLRQMVHCAMHQKNGKENKDGKKKRKGACTAMHFDSALAVLDPQLFQHTINEKTAFV